MPSYEPVENLPSKPINPNNGKKIWNKKKWLKQRSYAEDAIDDRTSILRDCNINNPIRITKKILTLCLTFGCGLHKEAHYTLLTKNNLRQKSGWQSKVRRKFISYKDLESLFQFTQQREASQIRENTKHY